MIHPFHLLFLASFAVVAAGLLVWGCIKGLKGGWIASIVVGCCFVGLLFHQAYWQVRGGGNVALTQFKRTHDVRPPVREDQRRVRGRLLDRKGVLLSGPRQHDKWGHEAPLGPAAFHLVGYDIKGRGTTGLERVFAPRLWGIAPPETLSDFLQTPKPEDVTLSIDARLQRLAYDLMDGRRGAVVISDPRTGEILALVSSPAPNEANFIAAERDRKNTPLFNRATQGLYPPGSVFKLFSAAVALEKGKGGRYVCPPKGWAPGAHTKPIRDTHPQKANVAVAIDKAFAESSNIWFAKALSACGWKAVEDAAARCGLREGITLAACGSSSMGSKAGVVPELHYALNRIAYLGFGQGDLRLTPLHVAALTATIANDGVYMPLHVERKMTVKGNRIWSRPVATRVKELMRGSVTSGTSRQIAIAGLEICGKTGTAENSGPDHAWFTCFAPAKKPQIAITVLIENGGFGASAALPVARELLKSWSARKAEFP